MLNSIGCIGQGFVGGSLTTGMSHAFDVYVYDKVGKVASGGKVPINSLGSKPNSISEFIERLEQFNTYKDNFTGVYFVCLPTPMMVNGECDTRIVHDVLSQMAKVSGSRIAVIKSTVPPGSTEAWNKEFEGTGLQVVFNPEFLREASALDDFKNQSRIILGGPKKAVNKVRDVYKVAFPNVPIVKTSSVNAEMNKYFINTFLATKVSFANEIYQICEALKQRGDDVDYDRIIELVTLDDRIGKSHLQVPGPMPSDDEAHELRRGYSGSCFSKDVNGLIYLGNSLGVKTTVLTAGWKKNEEVRPERDWEKLTGRAVSAKED